jgi:hypothetical protein
MKLPQNEAPLDRIIRVIVGALLVVAAVTGLVAAPISYIALAVAAILLVTGIVGFCPLYAVLHVSTAPRRS